MDLFLYSITVHKILLVFLFSLLEHWATWFEKKKYEYRWIPLCHDWIINIAKWNRLWGLHSLQCPSAPGANMAGVWSSPLSLF